MVALTRQVTISNKKGLHARAAAKLVKMAACFQAQITVTRLATDPAAEPDPEWVVSALSILGLMMLGAEPGTQLELAADGEQAAEALDALEQLISDRFQEGE